MPFHQLAILAGSKSKDPDFSQRLQDWSGQSSGWLKLGWRDTFEGLPGPLKYPK